jgi:DNA-binding response OmpR family regulator
MIQVARREEPLRKHAHLLIVDDDPDLCDLVQRYLEAEGFVTSVVHNGAAGSHAGTSGNYDLIVLDVMLPDMKGFDVLRELRSRVRTPVLMLTAKGDEFDRFGPANGGRRLFGKAIQPA